MLELDQREEWALNQTMHQLERRWNLIPIPDNSVYHAHDPLPLQAFFPAVRAAEKLTEGRRFLDLGCGMGTKLALMSCLGWQVAGIDKHLPYVEAARDLLPGVTVTHSDILEVDRIDADFVYMYRPGVSDETEEELERHIVPLLAEGTVLYLPYREPSFLGEPRSDGFFRWMWVI